MIRSIGIVLVIWGLIVQPLMAAMPETLTDDTAPYSMAVDADGMANANGHHAAQDTGQSSDTPCPLVRKLIDQRMEAIREEMRDAQKLMSRMESASSDWRDLPDRTPSGESICHLIETWDSTAPVDDNPHLTAEQSDDQH